MNPILLTPEDKEKIYSRLRDALIVGLQNGTIVDEEGQKSAEFVLTLDTVKTQEELLTFLQNLSTRWPAYETVYIELKTEEEKKKDQEKISTIETTLNTLQTQ